ncbi:flavodoxin [uncultured Proteiniphilum sp.]|uniref:flavodoxin n=1 Tax=uncultured Proteiniphilum sp. TaxID=497637 RepID=UPI0026248720|nr:flavodoxin [uncultured Proteiniphilum sp.]
MKMIILSIIIMTATLSAFVQNSKTLVVYYSRTGNAEAVAKQIQTLTNADLFRVETVKAYPEGYHETTEVAKEEKNNNARPEIKTKVENIDQYDTVFIGFPIWWGTYPMVIATFIESHNLKGKTIIPFCTHGGGSVDQGFNDVEKLTKESKHEEGFSLSGSRANSSQADIEKWLRKILSLQEG